MVTVILEKKNKYMWFHTSSRHLFGFHMTKIVLFQLNGLKTMLLEIKISISTEFSGLWIILGYLDTFRELSYFLLKTNTVNSRLTWDFKLAQKTLPGIQALHCFWRKGVLRFIIPLHITKSFRRSKLLHPVSS